MNRLTVVILWLWACFLCRAKEEGIPCLILTGNADGEMPLDLAEYRRITFGSETMTISNPDNPENAIELLYAVYNRLEVGQSTPYVGIEEVDAASFKLCYSKEQQALYLSTDETANIGIFTLGGTLIAKSKSNRLSIAQLSEGTYIAIAIGANASFTLKFIK